VTRPLGKRLVSEQLWPWYALVLYALTDGRIHVVSTLKSNVAPSQVFGDCRPELALPLKSGPPASWPTSNKNQTASLFSKSVHSTRALSVISQRTCQAVAILAFSIAPSLCAILRIRGVLCSLCSGTRAWSAYRYTFRRMAACLTAVTEVRSVAETKCVDARGTLPKCNVRDSNTVPAR
jgi:hypothetical protein